MSPLVTDSKNRFNAVYHKILNARLFITAFMLVTFLLVLGGIGLCIILDIKIIQEWKEIIIFLLGAFVGSFTRSIDYWFNNSQRDSQILEKMDQENDSDNLVVSKLEMQNRTDKKTNTEEPIENIEPVENIEKTEEKAAIDKPVELIDKPVEVIDKPVEGDNI